MTTHIENLQVSSSLKQILGLKWSPIGVRLVKRDEKPKDTPLESTRLRYCQLLMEAKKGKMQRSHQKTYQTRVGCFNFRHDRSTYAAIEERN